MSEVALQIGGRTYRVACAAGEEERVTRLGATISDKLAAMGNPAGPDAQNLLFAALLLADEVQDGREAVAAADAAKIAAARVSDTATNQRAQYEARIADLEAELTRLQGAAQASADEVDRARASEASLRQAIAGLESEAATLRGKNADLEQAATAQSAKAPSGDPDLAALAPALERFAEMLEECADKLESRTATS